MAKKTGKVTLEDLDSDKPLLIGKRKRLAFLDMLLFAAKSGADLNHSDIQEEVDTFMAEGHDTTATGVSWAVHLIGANPDVQKKLHKEMDRVFGDDEKRPLTMEDLKDLKYLECVIKESLRIFPSVPLLGRTITEDCKIGGFDVPKGATCVVVIPSLHRNVNNFPDPERFDPDRWLPENCADIHPFGYIPFSAGSRNCIGQKFAMNEEKVMLSYILRRFGIVSVQEREDLHPVADLALRPQNGIRVKLTHRK